jgi:predicted NAD/FAD-binding protein
LSGRPTWRTVTGGSQTYVAAFQKQFQGTIKVGQSVDAVSAGDTCAYVSVGGQMHSFDKVVIATHADQAWRLLAEQDLLLQCN